MAKRKTEHRIIQSGLNILATQGSHGFTMRKVSTGAGVTLSNLQYHFKNRDALLMGIIDYYLFKCVETGNNAIISLPDKASIKKTDIRNLLISLLDNESKHNLCKTFKEIWAISTRNEIIKKHLDNYYIESALLINKVFGHLISTKRQGKKLVAVLIPYFEGYSITANALPLPPKQIANLLTDIVWDILTLNADSEFKHFQTI